MKMNIVIIALCPAFFADAIGQTNQIAMTTDSVVTKDVAPAPAANEIVTRTGAIYERAEILKVEPDGLTIGYVPPGGGMGMIKIPLADLSGDFQTKYGYDYEKALEYQKEQQKEIGRWREKMIADEAAARAKPSITRKALASTCLPSSPLANKSQHTSATLVGDGRIIGRMNPNDDSNCQTISTTTGADR